VIDLVEAFVCGASADVQVEAESAVATQRSVRGGAGRDEDSISLVVAIGAGSALQPQDVTASVQHEVHALGGRTHGHADEVLSTTQTEA